VEAGLESGDADGGGTHVNAAAGLAEIERHANHADLARGDVAVRRASLSHTLPIHRRDAEVAEKSLRLVLFGLRRLYFRPLGVWEFIHDSF
jgi:hypothetical protein